MDDEERRAILTQLRRVLRQLASGAEEQIGAFPAGFACVAEEMALDFDDWLGMASLRCDLSEEQDRKLRAVDVYLGALGGSSNVEFWSDEALASDPRWREARRLAEAALVSLDGPMTP